MPAESRVLSLPFPASGVVRRQSIRLDADGTPGSVCPWALNVRLQDALDKRLRGGSWAGISSTAVPADRSLYLTDASGNNITTEGGDPIIVGSEASVVSSGGRVWVLPGAAAPASGDADVFYRGRLIRTDGNAIHASRIGDYEDWSYGVHVEDESRPWVIQLSEAGEVGGTVKALVPWRDSFLLGFTADSLWVLQGDPTAGGTLRNITRECGVVSARAWCVDLLDRVYFLSSHGLYVCGADGSGLSPISEDLIPVELTGVTDPDTVLTYNHADRGVYIEIPTAAVSWFYDTARQQFWPYDTESSNSHVLLGPYRLGGADTLGMIRTLHGITAAGSATVTWRIVTGDSAEEAADNGKAAIEAFQAGESYASYVQSSGVWTAGRSLTSRPRTRAMWACVWLQSAGSWAFEGATAQIAPAGRWR